MNKLEIRNSINIIKMNKFYISYNEVHNIIQKLSVKILKDFKPDVIISITGGGLVPSRIIRNYLKCDVLCVGVKLYNADDTRNNKIVKYQWLENNLENKKVLIVDEVDDTRTTLEYVIKELKKENPKELACCVIHNKIKEKICEIPSYCSYYVGEETDDVWIAYPWETDNINEHQRHCKK